MKLRRRSWFPRYIQYCDSVIISVRQIALEENEIIKHNYSLRFVVRSLVSSNMQIGIWYHWLARHLVFPRLVPVTWSPVTCDVLCIHPIICGIQNNSRVNDIVYKCVHTHATHTRAHTRTHARTHSHANTRPHFPYIAYHTPTPTHAHKHKYKHTQTHTNTHTRARARTHFAFWIA